MTPEAQQALVAVWGWLQSLILTTPAPWVVGTAYGAWTLAKNKDWAPRSIARAIGSFLIGFVAIVAAQSLLTR